MKINGGIELLQENLHKQLSSYWTQIDFEVIMGYIPAALERISKVLHAISTQDKYVWQNGNVVFSPLHSVQYSIFLYILSNCIYRARGGIREADCIYYLNKIMNSCDWFYAIELPEIFYAEHPVGSVLGRARYGDRFFIYQGCTVGGNVNKDGILSYPIIGKNVWLYAGSSILGKCRIGDNVIISAGTRIINREIPSCSIVFGNSPNLIVKEVCIEEMKMRQSNIWG